MVGYLIVTCAGIVSFILAGCWFNLYMEMEDGKRNREIELEIIPFKAGFFVSFFIFIALLFIVFI